MTDKPTAPVPEPKDAVPAGTFSKPPEKKKLSFGQQFFIWILILVVGVVFGIGTPVSLLMGGSPANIIGDISQAEVIPRLQTMQRLERVLNPNGSPYQPMFAPGPREDPQMAVAQQLRIARLAESRGLMPKGQALDRLEQEFLGRQVAGSKDLSYGQALRSHLGGADQVQPEDLRRYLQERAAGQGLVLRSAVPPVVPRDAGAEAYTALVEQAEVTEVVLTGTRLLPAVKDDDPDILSAYQQLRGARFQRPVAVVLALAIADRDAFAKDITVSEAEAKAWYDAHQDDYRDQKMNVVKPFDQVKEAATTAVRNDRATARAEALAERFSNEVDVLDGDKDPAKFAAAAAKAGLALEEMTVEDRNPGTIDLGKHGTLKDLIGLFGHEHDPGFIARPAQTSTGAWVVLRLAARHEAGFLELDAVRPQVVRYLAGRRAWKPLLAEAARIRDQAKGPGALAAWAASADGQAWGAKPKTEPQPITASLPTPPAEADGQAGDPVLLGRLAMPDRPVAITVVVDQPQPWERRQARVLSFVDDVPQVRLVQVAGIKPAELAGMDRRHLAEVYRSILGGYSEAVLQRELNQQLEKR